MTDMSKIIQAKSDQLNADDLIAGEKVITITSVSIAAGDQPVTVYYEGDDGKPYKPCKSMCRVMVKAWGADANEYAGRSMKLYNDPTVKWAGREAGGIRIAAMTHIDAPIAMNLTTTRGKRSPFRVEVMEVQQQQEGERDLAASLAADFEACGSLDDLRALWEKLPAPMQAMAKEYKDAAKARLQGEQA